MFTILVEIYVGEDFFRIFDDKSLEVSLIVLPETDIKGETTNYTFFGVATFNKLYFDEIGNYEIISFAERVYQGNSSIPLIITYSPCAMITFSNNTIVFSILA